MVLGGNKENRCLWCKFFWVPDNGQEWGPNGICERIEPHIGVLPRLPQIDTIIWDSMTNDVANIMSKSGHVIVKQWHYCPLCVIDALRYEIAHQRKGEVNECKD